MSVAEAEVPKMPAWILVALLAVSCGVSAQVDLESEARTFLQMFDEEATQRIYNYSLASWAYNTNITKETSEKLVSIASRVAAADLSSKEQVPLQNFDVSLFSLTSHKREVFGASSTPTCQSYPRNTPSKT